MNMKKTLALLASSALCVSALASTVLTASAADIPEVTLTVETVEIEEGTTTATITVKSTFNTAIGTAIAAADTTAWYDTLKADGKWIGTYKETTTDYTFKGFGSVGFKFTYDENLTSDGAVEFGDGVSALSCVPLANDAKKTIVFSGAAATPQAKEGQILSFTFTVPETAKEGDFYPVNLALQKFSNSDAQQVTYDIVNGGVKVIAKATEPTTEETTTEETTTEETTVATEATTEATEATTEATEATTEAATTTAAATTAAATTAASTTTAKATTNPTTGATGAAVAVAGLLSAVAAAAVMGKKKD